MKIRHLSTAVVESNFDWTIVKVETDEKITGFGEAFLGPGLTAVILEFAAILIGEDPTSIDRLLRRMHASTVYASPLIEKGQIAVPDKPGLGIELDLDVAYRYRKPGEKFFD